jgi:hypothetical protein
VLGHLTLPRLRHPWPLRIGPAHAPVERKPHPADALTRPGPSPVARRTGHPRTQRAPTVAVRRRHHNRLQNSPHFQCNHRRRPPVQAHFNADRSTELQRRKLNPRQFSRIPEILRRHGPPPIFATDGNQSPSPTGHVT